MKIYILWLISFSPLDNGEIEIIFVRGNIDIFTQENIDVIHVYKRHPKKIESLFDSMQKKFRGIYNGDGSIDFYIQEVIT